MKLPSLLVLLTCVVAACSSPTPDRPPLKELQRTTAGDLEVVLLAPNDALSLGKSQPTLEFQSRNDHHLVDVGAVKATATMPMEGTSPMQGSVFVNRTGTPGRYVLDADLGMNGTWHLTVSWDGPAGKGAAAFPGTVR